MQSVFQVLKEVKPLVWIFVLQNLPQLAYFIYLLYTVSLETHLFFYYLQSCLHHVHDSVKHCTSLDMVQLQLRQKIHLGRNLDASEQSQAYWRI